MPKTKRRSIGANPLDAVVPGGKTSRKPAPAEKPSKVRATFHLPAELLSEARDAVVFLSGPPVRLTLADLAETALRRELERLRKAHHKGKPFPPRDGDLKGGRPIRS